MISSAVVSIRSKTSRKIRVVTDGESFRPQGCLVKPEETFSVLTSFYFSFPGKRFIVPNGAVAEYWFVFIRCSLLLFLAFRVLYVLYPVYLFFCFPSFRSWVDLLPSPVRAVRMDVIGLHVRSICGIFFYFPYPHIRHCVCF